MKMCYECKWLSYDVMGAAICTREVESKKASPYVVACECFDRKETEE